MIKKLIYLLIFLIIAEVIVGIIYLRKGQRPLEITVTPPQKVPGPKLSFSPSTGNFNVDQIINVKILVDTKGKVLTGVDSVIKYNPESVEVIGDPTPGDIFPFYPVLKVKREKGEISITGTVTDPSQPLFSGQGEFATIVVKPLKAGSLKLTFEFTPGKTDDSNLAEKGTGNDVLTEVVNARFNITRNITR